MEVIKTSEESKVKSTILKKRLELGNKIVAKNNELYKLVTEYEKLSEQEVCKHEWIEIGIFDSGSQCVKCKWIK